MGVIEVREASKLISGFIITTCTISRTPKDVSSPIIIETLKAKYCHLICGD